MSPDSSSPQVATSGGQLCSAELQPAPDRTTLELVQPTPSPRSHRARGARKVGPGSRPLPEGIEVCCRSRSHDSSAWASPVPNPPPIAGTAYGCQRNQPVQCTGTGHQGGGRSVSDPRPDAPTAEPRPRRVRPVQRAVPRATRHHHVVARKKVFRLFCKY